MSKSKLDYNIQTNTTGRLTPCLQKKIDKTTCLVEVHFSDTSTQNVEDKQQQDRRENLFLTVKRDFVSSSLQMIQERQEVINSLIWNIHFSGHWNMQDMVRLLSRVSIFGNLVMNQ